MSRTRLPILAGMILALLVNPSAKLNAGEQPERPPKKTAVTGSFNWAIVPVNLPPYVLVGADGDLYLRNMPLVGTLALTGEGITLDPATTRISINLDGELDPVTFSGLLWGPMLVTGTIDGVKTLLFQGTGTADTVGLVSVGKVTLAGHGPYEGTRLEFTFEEIGPGNTDTYTVSGRLARDERR